MKYLWEQLKRLVDSIDITDTKLRESQIVLFGAGFKGSLSYERMVDKYKIIGFSDNNKEIWGGGYEGLPIIEPDRIKELKNPVVVITMGVHYHAAIKEQMKEQGVCCISYMELLLKRDFAKFESVYFDLLEDDFSRQTYLTLLMVYITGDVARIKDIFVRDQYFVIPEIYSMKNNVFVDCGAFVGDTLEKFVWIRDGLFRKIYAFEPGEPMQKALLARKKRLVKEWSLDNDSIVLERKIIGEVKGTRHFVLREEDLLGSHVAYGYTDQKITDIEAIDLDSYFIDIESKPTFIKADIEGAELELINGARYLISNYKPLLALSIYHRDEDLYELPIKLKELNIAYKMAIRHHGVEYQETVLYCY